MPPSKTTIPDGPSQRDKLSRVVRTDPEERTRTFVTCAFHSPLLPAFADIWHWL